MPSLLVSNLFYFFPHVLHYPYLIHAELHLINYEFGSFSLYFHVSFHSVVFQFSRI